MQSLKKIHEWAQMKVPLSITKSISKIFFQTLCVFSQIKDTKPTERNFHSVLLHASGVGLGGAGGGVSKMLVWRIANAPHRLRILKLH